jgi:low affinity Fe/Cu permease
MSLRTKLGDAMCAVSAAVAVAAAHPLAQAGVLLACGAWLRSNGSVDDLTLILSIVAITLAQMILAADRRDKAALHAKLDEIIRAGKARDEFRGIEQRPASEVEEMRS